LENGEAHPAEIGIAQFAAREEFRQRMPQQFADAQLSLTSDPSCYHDCLRCQADQRPGFVRQAILSETVTTALWFIALGLGARIHGAPGPRSNRESRPGAHADGVERLVQRAAFLGHPVALDYVAYAHVLVVLERHAAFLSGLDFANLVLEALERSQLTLVNDDVVADQPHLGTALHGSLGHP